jgi:two-component sensor histidine kinase
MQFPDGDIIAEVSLTPILDDAGACVHVLWKSSDVTDKRRADAQLRASLAEKDTLLREVHHRVKNNLQIVNSMLHFQGKKSESTGEMDALRELRLRISAMALAHERLYLSRDVARIRFGSYARTLVADAVRTFRCRESVRIDITGEDPALSIEVAQPAGLILCELLSNVLKHAFPGDRDGTALVTVRLDGDHVVLSVDDDGVGFPEGAAPFTGGGSFGWQLIRTLVQQIDGTGEATTDHGAHIRVSFPVTRWDRSHSASRSVA